MLLNCSLIYILTSHCVVVDTVQIYSTSVEHRARVQAVLTWVCVSLFKAAYMFCEKTMLTISLLSTVWEHKPGIFVLRKCKVLKQAIRRTLIEKWCKISVWKIYVFEIKTEFDSRSQLPPLASDGDDEGHSQGDGERSVMESIIDSAHWGWKGIWH